MTMDKDAVLTAWESFAKQKLQSSLFTGGIALSEGEALKIIKTNTTNCVDIQRILMNEFSQLKRQQYIFDFKNKKIDGISLSVIENENHICYITLYFEVTNFF